jgi:hypothetical protein
MLLLDGVFHNPGTGLSVFPDGKDPQSLDDALAPYEGSPIHFSLHHFPTSPPDPTVPGGGSCLWNGYCPCGHNEDPAWLFNMSVKGVLERLESGKWAVSGSPVPLDEMMTGHRGRLVLFRGVEVDQDKGIEDLLTEAEGLLSILEGLRGAMKS